MRSDGMRAQIIGKEGTILKVHLFDELTDEDIKRYMIDGKLFATVELFSKNSITSAQRRHIYALFGDMEAHTGHVMEYWESKMKLKFMHFDFMQKLPSLANNQMTKERASKFLEYIIVYCIQKEIPFRRDRIYLPKESTAYLYYATMKRYCMVCGKPDSQLHHATSLIGMGRDRTKHNHLESTFMMLCANHHHEVHNIGLFDFCKKYILQPIKLSKRDLDQLNIQGNYKDDLNTINGYGN